ncbi:VirB4 family type IV secretion system protein [Thermoanaerobacter sp. CM-CNRG TB177]|uniref:VirB4 family type IV secretion system protein n=2 Tax=Thermoanaerobacter sp. CM-CNRG TB177 TaxID=2800659 RepID=UPI00210679D4|nr:ATP-binding protein [Thermoanaerobacter sp. CM-CNRG TB177]
MKFSLFNRNGKLKENKKQKLAKKVKENDFHDPFNHVSDIKQIISPDGIYIDRNYMQINDKYVRVYYFTDYPASVGIGWLDSLKLFSNANISVHIYPENSGAAIKKLTHKIVQLQSQLMLDEEEGNIAELGILQRASESLETLRENIQMNRDKLFYVTIVIAIYADSLQELERNSRTLEEVLAGKSIKARNAMFRQEQGFKTLLPLAENYLADASRNFNVGAAISLFPFASPEYSHKQGIPIGINLFTGSPVVFDPFIGPPILPNANIAVFAQSGAGKSFMMKLIALRSALLGVRTVFIDPDGEYKNVVNRVGGVHIKLEPNCKYVINPFDIEADVDDEGIEFIDLLQKANEIKGLVSMIIEKISKTPITAYELSLIEESVLEEYRSCGITRNPESLYEQSSQEVDGKYYIGLRPKQMPTLSSFTERLSKKPGGEKLAQILKPYLRGGTMGLFDGQSNVDLKDALLISFDVSGIVDEFLKTYALYVVTNWVWEKFVKKNIKQKKFVIVDEAWMFMKYEHTANFLENLARRARKRNTSLTIASQSFIEFANSPQGKAVLTNAATVFLLRQSPTDIDAVQEVFHLSKGEREFLLSSGIGEALLKAGRNSTVVRVVASEYEREFITTNPNEQT